jgi:hypothetical protein
MKIFNVIFCMLICLAPAVLRADDDTECGYFNPAFGLCSVHSHNIAALDSTTQLPINPTKSEETAQMNEVIAMKSTIIAQQLKEQYDQLNAVVKRFKTQLEKAVLTSKIEVLTGNAASGNSGGGASGSYNNNGLANAEDCYAVSQENAYDCVVRNLSKISSAAEKDITNARKQLDNDLAIMDGYKMCGKTVTSCAADTTGCKEKDVKYMNKSAIQSCIKNLQIKVRSGKADFDRENAQARWGRY